MTNSPPKSELQDEENDLFYFESDHLALKGNIEYSELLKTIFILEAQRKRAIDDYNKVVELQKQAEENPLSIVETLKNGGNLNVPDLQCIVDVPKINWSKYNISIPEECLKIINSDKNDNVTILKTDDLKYKSSSNTHSKPWTFEEQKRLEELLITYPPEDIELRRFKKIANALGTRTVKQVCSRVQKYFLKLCKAGLPIPGRIPKAVDKRRSHKHQRLNHLLKKPSTFFPQLNIPVVMNENEDVPGPSQSSKSSYSSYEAHSSNYLLTTNYHDEQGDTNKSDLDLQLELLKIVKSEKQRENETMIPLFRHVGFKCDYCSEEPIAGSRWHCTTCKGMSVDFCTDCVLSQMYSTDRHPLSHKLLIIRDDSTTITPDSDSSSESVSGSAVGSSNKNFETSDSNSDESLDTEDDENRANEQNKYVDAYQINDNDGLIEEQTSVSIKEETDAEYQSYANSVDNSNEFNSHEFQYDNVDFICDNDVKTEIEESKVTVFTDTQNISYDYLHSKLFLDDS